MILTLVKSTLLLKHLTLFGVGLLLRAYCKKLLVIKYFLLVILKINQINCSIYKNIPDTISQNTYYI